MRPKNGLHNLFFRTLQTHYRPENVFQKAQLSGLALESQEKKRKKDIFSMLTFFISLLLHLLAWFPERGQAPDPVGLPHRQTRLCSPEAGMAKSGGHCCKTAHIQPISQRYNY